MNLSGTEGGQVQVLGSFGDTAWDLAGGRARAESGVLDVEGSSLRATVADHWHRNLRSPHRKRFCDDVYWHVDASLRIPAAESEPPVD
jgi:hypothetical protein